MMKMDKTKPGRRFVAAKLPARMVPVHRYKFCSFRSGRRGWANAAVLHVILHTEEQYGNQSGTCGQRF